MIKLVKVLEGISDEVSGLFQKVRCAFFGKQQDLNVLNLYGIAFNPPGHIDGDGKLVNPSFGVAFSANGYDNNIFVAVDNPELRFTGLAEGELKIGNYLTGDYVYFKADGSIKIDAAGEDIFGNVNIDTGFNGTFTTGTGQTVTVTHGIITNIV